MLRATLSLFVCFLGEIYPGLTPGDRVPARHPDFLDLKRARTRNLRTRWTMPASAAPGDRCLYYYKSPLSSFVATATVVDPPQLETRGYWKDHYTARIGSVQLLPRPVPLSEVQAAFPEWGWARAPRRSAGVPEFMAARLLRYLGDKARLRAVEASAVEGIKRETLRITRSRSGALRQQALSKAKGRCECCGLDFSVLQWNGLRAPLQVHHLRQLSLTENPRTTRARDLVALCANCHAVIHSDPKRALTVAAVRPHMLRRWTRQ
jgi:hypothetical protein